MLLRHRLVQLMRGAVHCCMRRQLCRLQLYSCLFGECRSVRCAA
jgi:hypothetical protein